MANRPAPSMPRQWILAALLAIGGLFVAFVSGWDLVGFAFMLLVTLAAVFFLRRTGSR